MNLTRKTQEIVKANMSMEDALPTKMPLYVNSFAYLFGVVTLVALFALVVTGIVMTLFGPEWYHFSAAGHFVNSMHFWGAQIFFAALIAHLLTKFFMAAWRDGRWKTWIVGTLALGISVFEAFTGYLSQTNFDSQWIAVQSKDAMNALGVGAFFNAMNTSQALTLHVVALPAAVGLLVVVHLILIRSDGPVKPFGEDEKPAASAKRSGR